MEHERKLNQLKENLEKAKGLRIRAEARLEQLNRQKQEILDEILALGIKPEELDSEIQRLNREIEELIKTADEMLPMNITNGK
ncbi:MAG: hypothetical protein N2489_10015 [Clostridia bacterium]|nr:hypothetical protein [Clostridia bacterium]